jgi:hypothetical protein
LPSFSNDHHIIVLPLRHARSPRVDDEGDMPAVAATNRVAHIHDDADAPLIGAAERRAE